jgi:nicotinic acetylcholine receptor
MVVLLDIVATAMPKSNSIPLLGYFIIAMILINALGVAINMSILGVSRKFIETEKMPGPLAYSMVFMNSPKRQIDYWEAGAGNLDYFEGLTIQPPKFPDLVALFNRVQEIAQAQNVFRKRQEKQKWLNAVSQISQFYRIF